MAQLGPGAAVVGTESSAGEPILPAGEANDNECVRGNVQ